MDEGRTYRLSFYFPHQKPASRNNTNDYEFDATIMVNTMEKPSPLPCKTDVILNSTEKKKREDKVCGDLPSNNDDNNNRGELLKDCVVTTTGFSSQHKAKLRQIISDLGGIYTAELRVGKCTHLIAQEASGSKFEEAFKVHPNNTINHSKQQKIISSQKKSNTNNKSSKERTIHIMRPTWLYACASEKKRVSEKLHSLVPYNTNSFEKEQQPQQTSRKMKSQNNTDTYSKNIKQLEPKKSEEKEIAKIHNFQIFQQESLSILKSKPITTNFMQFRFYLAGYSPPYYSPSKINDNIMVSSQVGDSKSLSCFERGANNDEIEREDDLVSGLIRLGMGTIFWNLTNDLTHIIVNPSCDITTL